MISMLTTKLALFVKDGMQMLKCEAQSYSPHVAMSTKQSRPLQLQTVVV